MAIETLVLNLLVLAVSGVTGLLVTQLFRRLDGIAKDLKALGAEVGSQAKQLAEGDVEIRELKRRVGGIEDRERERFRVPRAVGE